MIDTILNFVHNLSNLISVDNPVGLAVIFGMVVFADIGIVIPFIIEPALFLITFQSGPFSVPVWLFVLMMTLGRQAGTALLYWASRLIGIELARLLRRFFPRRAERFARRVNQFGHSMGRNQSIALAIARLTPGLVQVSTIASGTLRISYPYVMLGALIAGLIYDSIIVFLGGLAHYGLQGVNPDFALYISLGISVIMGLLSFLFARYRRKKA